MVSPIRPPLSSVRVVELRSQAVLSADEIAELLRGSRTRFLDRRRELYAAGFPRPLEGFGLKWSAAAVFRFLDGAPGGEGDGDSGGGDGLGTAVVSPDDEERELRRARRRQAASQIASAGRAA